MHRLSRHLFVALAMLIVGLALPCGSAMAQDETFCSAARAAANGGASTYQGYDVVWAPQRGGAGNQVVLGTSESDTLVGKAGNDVLCGFEGDDILNGGTGNDILVGGTGYNVLKGGSGNDSLIGMAGDDFRPGLGNDEVTEMTPVDTRAANITFRQANSDSCFADVNVSGFAPNPSFRFLTYVAADASGTNATYNGYSDIQIDSDGTTTFTVSSGWATLLDGAYLQVSGDDYTSPWTLIDCL